MLKLGSQLRLVILFLVVTPLWSSTGCYYAHLGIGQTKLLLAREPVEELLANPKTDPTLQSKLALVERARAYASEIGLDVDDRYSSYVEWPGDRVVTTVVATRPGQIAPALFRFPIVGDVPYKGYFDKARAEREAERLRGKGFDVCLLGVRAYSTLGWLADPLTAPMVATKPDRLVQTVLHELVHATVFVESQPEFNEGIASFIGQEAVILFYGLDPPPAPQPSPDYVRERVADDRAIAVALIELRQRIADLYAGDLEPAVRDDRRARIVADALERIATIPLATRDPSKIAKRVRVNDACLALQGTYATEAPRFQRLLDALDGDLVRFIARLREAAEKEDPSAAFFALPVDLPASPAHR